MAASDKTIKQIVEVFSRHLNAQNEVRDLIVDLYHSVKGNKSVEATLKKLEKETR